MKGIDETQGAQSFLRFLSDLRVTALLTVESPVEEVESAERLLARGEIRLFRWELEGRTVRAIGVEKFRGSAHDNRLHPYRISPSGLDVDLNTTISRDTRRVIDPSDAPGSKLGIVEVSPRPLELNLLLSDVRDLAALGIDVKPAEAEIAAGSAAQAGKIDEVAIHFIRARAVISELAQHWNPRDAASIGASQTTAADRVARIASEGADLRASGAPPRLLESWDVGPRSGEVTTLPPEPAQALPRRPEPPSTSTLEPSVLPEPSLVASPPPPPPPPPPDGKVVTTGFGFNANPWTSAASATPASAAASPHHGTGARYAESRAVVSATIPKTPSPRPSSTIVPAAQPPLPGPTAPSSGPPVLPPPAATEAPPEPPILPKTVPAGVHGDRPGPAEAKFVLPSRTSLGRYEGGPLGRSMFPLRSVLKPRHGTEPGPTIAPVPPPSSPRKEVATRAERAARREKPPVALPSTPTEPGPTPVATVEPAQVLTSSTPQISSLVPTGDPTPVPLEVVPATRPKRGARRSSKTTAAAATEGSPKPRRRTASRRSAPPVTGAAAGTPPPDLANPPGSTESASKEPIAEPSARSDGTTPAPSGQDGASPAAKEDEPK